MNILKYIQLTISFLLFAIVARGQSIDPILFTVANEKVTAAEFKKAYIKAKTEGDLSVDAFLKSYIDFKLKIIAAKSLKLEESDTFRHEYYMYLDQLKTPYLTDTISLNLIAQREYERLKKNIEISAVFVKLPEGDVFPKDTLKAFKSALNIKSLIADKSISKLAEIQGLYSKELLSDNSISIGYIGWRSAFMQDNMLENAIYSTPVGAISDPIRSEHGYYILKSESQRSDLGEIDVSHILFRYTQANPSVYERDSLKSLVNKVYSELLAGANFANKCKEYSADRTTAAKDGYIGRFSVRNPLPKEFESLLFGLNVGEIAPPAQTEYGYHIFKLDNKLVLGSWTQMRNDVLGKISSDKKFDTVDLLNRLEVKAMSDDYPYAVNKEVYEKMELVANTFHPKDSIYCQKISVFKNEPLLVISDSVYHVSDFTAALLAEISNKKEDYNLSTDYLQAKLYAFILGKLIEEKSNTLTDKYPQFRELANGYYEGMLLFEIMDKEVWSKAQSDKAELQVMYEKNKAKYKWDAPRFKGFVVSAGTKAILDEAKSIIKQNKNNPDLLAILVKSLNTDSVPSIVVERGLWRKEDNSFVNRVVFKSKTKPLDIVGYPYYLVEGKLLSEPEDISQIQGLVVADYQQLLEEKWLEDLRQKYKVEVNNDVLNSIR